MTKDDYRLRGLRVKLVKTLRKKGISDEKVLSAFLEIKRHHFLDRAFSDWAYKDVAFPIDSDQTISQPYTVAVQSSLLNVVPGDKVLEVGTGSGFQACILAHLGAKVYTIERIQRLYEETSKLLINIGFPQVRTLYGDGYQGAPRFAPYDKIIVTAGATEVPKMLIDQLKIGGIMVIPSGASHDKTMFRIFKQKAGKFKVENHGIFRFVPFLPGKNSGDRKPISKRVVL